MRVILANAVLLATNILLLGWPVSDLQSQDPSPPVVTIRAKATSYTPTQVDTVEWCDDANLVGSLRKIWLNGQDVTGSFTYTTATKAGCGKFARSIGTITLDPGGDRNVIKARILDADGNEGQATAHVYYVPDPALSLAPHNGDNRQTSLCVSDCFEVTASYATAPYVSLDTARTITLLYRSAQARPMSMVQVDADDTESITATAMSLRLKRVDGSWVTFTNGSTEIFFAGGAGTSRLSAQFSDSTSVTGSYGYTLVVRYWNGSALLRERNAPIRVLTLNESNSSFGWGWSLVGLQQLTEQVNGSAVLTQGDGSIAYFSGTHCEATGACTLISPRGDFTTLKRTTTGSFERRYPNGVVVMYGGGGANWISSVKDRFDNTTTFAYSSGRLTQITDPAGKALRLFYGADTRLDSIVDPGGRVTKVTINAAGDLTEVVDPAGGFTLRAGYDNAHRLRWRADRQGGVWGSAYDFAGKIAGDTLPEIETAAGPARPVLRLMSLERQALVDPSSGVGSLSSPAPRVLGANLRAAIVDPRGNQVLFILDRFGAATRIEQPHGITTILERNIKSQITRVVNPDGSVIKNTWSGPNLTVVKDSLRGTTKQFLYESVFNEIREESGAGAPSIFYYWSGGKLDSTKIGTTTGPKTSFTYDSRGRLKSRADPGAHIVSFTYESSGSQNLYSTSSGGAEERYLSDYLGRRWSVRNRAEKWTTFTYDSLNRITLAVGPLSDSTHYVYDSLHLVSVTDPRGGIYQFRRNALGWTEAVTFPSSTPDSVKYDANGNVVMAYNRRGASITFEYDSLNRMTSRTANGRTTQFSYDPGGRWRAANNEEGADTIYVGSVSRTDSAISCRVSICYVTQSDFDLAGRRQNIRIVSPWSSQVEYHFGPKGVLDSIVDFSARRTALGHNIEQLPTQVTLPTDPELGLTHSFPSPHTPAQITFSDAALNDYLGFKYEYDGVGRVTERLNPKMNAGHEYKYDAHGRLKLRRHFSYPPEAQPSCPEYADHGFQCDTASKTYLDSTVYSYDLVGNRTDQGGVSDAANRLRYFGGDSLYYDADGNLSRRFRVGDSTAFSQRLYWDDLSQLERVETTRNNVQTIVEFGYDGFGRRARKSVVGASTRFFLWDGAHLIAEVDSANPSVPAAEFVYYAGSGAPHSMRRAGSIFYFTRQLPGSTVGALLDSTGVVVARYRYDDFGALVDDLGSVENPLRFIGRPYDVETGLYYFGARYYDPEIGRFISEDPSGLKGGINPYAYTSNDPVNREDPGGLTYYEMVCKNVWITIYVGSGYWSGWGEECEFREIANPGPGVYLGCRAMSTTKGLTAHCAAQVIGENGQRLSSELLPTDGLWSPSQYIVTLGGLRSQAEFNWVMIAGPEAISAMIESIGFLSVYHQGMYEEYSFAPWRNSNEYVAHLFFDADIKISGRAVDYLTPAFGAPGLCGLIGKGNFGGCGP